MLKIKPFRYICCFSALVFLLCDLSNLSSYLICKIAKTVVLVYTYYVNTITLMEASGIGAYIASSKLSLVNINFK